jgi:hypothetical protein
MTPLDLWKSFVDSFASIHDGVPSDWVVEQGCYPDTEGNRKINAFLATLILEQREVLAEMLVDSRVGGIHDALVVLNDRMEDGGVYSEEGVQMEFQPFDTELYYDYICRRAGDEWPDYPSHKKAKTENNDS